MEGLSMLFTAEAKAQGWRAVAVFDDGRSEGLIFVGRSSTHVRQEYAAAFLELYDEEDRAHVVAIELQQWVGAPDAGYWTKKNTLKIPMPSKTASKVKAAA
jgi:hypothetical protein